MDPLDAVPEAVLVLDADLRLAHQNDRAAALLGLNGAEGKTLADALTLIDDSGQICREPIPARGTSHRVAEQVLRVRLDDGRERPVAMAGRWQADGGLVLTFRSAGRREAVDAARSDLVATVSHEIRSPLTSVKGFTRTMLLKWDRYSDDQKKTFLETINEDADRVTRLLKELLDVSRIDANRVQLALQGVDFVGMATDVADKAKQRPDGEGRDLPVTIADGVPARIMADKDKIEQILTNLINNALRYAPDSAVRIAVAPWGEGGAQVSVADDGPGIALDQQKAIFRKFGRGRETRRAGTGLGLYITKGLARAHGGDVVLVSALGEGSTFTVTISPSTYDD